MLCCGLLGSAAVQDQDMLLELGAARVLTLLLDSSSWACCASGTAQISRFITSLYCERPGLGHETHAKRLSEYCAGRDEAQKAALELQACFGSMPALACAVKRLMARRQVSTGSRSSRAATSATEDGNGDVQQSTVSKQRDMAVKLAMQALLSTLWSSAASSAPAADRGARQPDQTSLPGWQRAAAGHFAEIIMTLPQLLSGMPSHIRTQLTSLKALEVIIPALDAIAEQQSPAEQKHAGQRDTASCTQCRASCQRC